MFQGQANGLSGSSIDPEGYLQFYHGLTSFLKDFKVDITDWMAEGDKLFIRWIAKARHRTKDKVIDWPGTSFGTYRDGKILEAHNYFDFMDLFHQLEIMPEQAVSRGLAGEEFLALPAPIAQGSKMLWTFPPLKKADDGECPIPSHEQLLQVLGSSVFGLISCDQHDCVCDGNSYFANLVGVPRSQLKGRVFSEWIHPESRASEIQAQTGLVAGNYEHYRHRVTLLGHRRAIPVELSAVAIRRKNGPVTILRSVEPLDADRLEQLLRFQDIERRLLSSELHDGLAQDLATLWVTLQAGAQTKSVPPPIYQHCCQLIQAMSREVNATMQVLRDGWTMEHRSLEEAILLLQARYRDSQSLDVRWQTTGELGRVEGLAAHFAYRILQEGLRNVEKHSGASSATVTIIVTMNDIALTVEDTGRGFSQRIGGFGLEGIENRCQLSGGTCHIASVPGQGTRLQCQLPRQLTLGSLGK